MANKICDYLLATVIVSSLLPISPLGAEEVKPLMKDGQVSVELDWQVIGNERHALSSKQKEEYKNQMERSLSKKIHHGGFTN